MRRSILERRLGAVWLLETEDEVRTAVTAVDGVVAYTDTRALYDTARELMSLFYAIVGVMLVFEAIIAVVIGGALLTGGYGSVLGAALGALIFGVVQQGLFFAGVESSLFRVFLGVILLGAVILNTYIRRMITGER